MIDSRSDGLVPLLLLRSLIWERSGQVFKAVQDVERALEEEDSLQVSYRSPSCDISRITCLYWFLVYSLNLQSFSTDSLKSRIRLSEKSHAPFQSGQGKAGSDRSFDLSSMNRLPIDRQ